MSNSIIPIVSFVVVILFGGWPIANAGDLNHGLVAYWPFDDGADPTADAIGGNDGTLINAPPYVVQDLGGNDIAPVFANQDALDFDGVSQYVEVSSLAPLLDDLGPTFTAAAWVKLDALEGTNFLGRDSCCPLGDLGPDRGWQLGIVGSQRLVCLVTGGPGKRSIIADATATVPIGQYFHAACVFDSSTQRIEIYQDGVKIPQAIFVSVGPFPLKPNVNTGVPLTIGAHAFNDVVGGVGLHLDGRIDEVRIYNRVLSDAEIADLAQGKFTISPASGTYSTTQNFDLNLILKVTGPAVSVVGASATLNGADVTAALVGCIIPGTLVSGGSTFRCPGLSGAVLGTGTHTLAVTLDLSDGTSTSDTVIWEVVGNTEP